VRGRILIAAAAIAAGALGYWTAGQLRPAAAPGHAAGERPVADTVVPFTLTDLDGRARSVDEWRGRLIVLNFWATWCAPCREEIPAFMALQETYGGRGLQVVGIAIDAPEAVRDYRDDLLIDYPILIGDRDAVDLMNRYGNLAGVLPYTVVIARDGRIVATKQGAYTHDELQAIVQPLL
jgi:thiol-disulfide isomerase/thioredoxin